MLSRFAAAFFVLSLLACSSEPEVALENATAGEVADEVADAGGTGSFVRPGRWESKLTFLEMDMPGMPPEAARQMKGMMGGAQAHVSCLTAQDVKRPREDFFAGAQGCRYDHFRMGGGKIDMKMNCTAKGATQVMEMAGTYSSDAYTMTMTSTGGPMEGMKMRMRVDAKRVGACDGTEDKA